MTLSEATKILENLPNREADCRCGNIQITKEETLAIKVVTAFLDGFLYEVKNYYKG